MIDVALPRVQRPSFFTGERLLPETLDDAFAGSLALHRLHNRVLHGWGIAFGLDVVGPVGATTVAVAPGYAIDSAGRDLVLAERRELEVPPVSATPSCDPVEFALTIGYVDDAQVRPETRAGVCGATGAVHRSDAPTVSFLPPDLVRAGLDVELARVKVMNCKLTEPRRLDRRRNALPAGRPYLAAGATPEGGTPWRTWPGGGAAAGVVTTVATVDAGFGNTPYYEARLEGPRFVSTALSPSGTPFVVDGTLAVDRPTAGSFDAIVLLPQGVVGQGSSSLPLNPAAVHAPRYLTSLGWRVVWVGVEG